MLRKLEECKQVMAHLEYTLSILPPQPGTAGARKPSIIEMVDVSLTKNPNGLTKYGIIQFIRENYFQEVGKNTVSSYLSRNDKYKMVAKKGRAGVYSIRTKEEDGKKKLP